MRSLLILLVCISALIGVGCGESENNPNKTNLALEQGQVQEQGKELFVALCQECHPRTGRGDYLKRIPATLLTKKSEHELMAWIRGVGQHREMPAFDSLEEEQLKALASYLHAEITR